VAKVMKSPLGEARLGKLAVKIFRNCGAFETGPNLGRKH